MNGTDNAAVLVVPVSVPAAESAVPSKKRMATPALIALDRVDDDGDFRLRPVGDVAALATDLARLGQLFPIDVRLKRPDRFQVVCGFRRVAALKFLQRDQVMARLHTDLSDDDALALALADHLHSVAFSKEDTERLFDQLQREGRLSEQTRGMIEQALATDDGLAAETVEGEGRDGQAEDEEVDADELASDVTVRLGELNQDLSLLGDVFGDLDGERRDELLKQLAYARDLLAFLESRT